MTRWGEGNFDNDFALDFLADVVDTLIENILYCLKPEHQTLDCGETQLMPAIDILVTLGRAYPYVVGFKLREQPIAQWKEKYVRIFEEESEFPMENEHQSQRRAIIVETFSRLEDIQKNAPRAP